MLTLMLIMISLKSAAAIPVSQMAKARPPTMYGRPLDVRVGMYFESLGNFRSNEMSFDADVYMYMSWKDVRLAHRSDDYILVNDVEARSKMWVPDLYFANARMANFQKVTVPNFNIFIAPDGQIAYSLRCTITVACNLDLRMYPMDHQKCSIRILSYAHIAKDVNVTWFDRAAIQYNPTIELPEFSIRYRCHKHDHPQWPYSVTRVAVKFKNQYCNGTYRYALMPNSYKIDDFSCLSGNLYLSRSLGYNLIQSYIPTGLIVIISWVSFWIDRRAVPARVTLSFTTLVSFTTLGSGLRMGLAQVSYAKAIDMWYGGCMVFVFLALLEFAVINSLMRKADKHDILTKKAAQDKNRSVLQVNANDLNQNHALSLEENLINAKRLERKRKSSIFDAWNFQVDHRRHHSSEVSRMYSRKALSIDKQCRIGFPVAFTIFNLVYWWYYLIHRVYY